MDIKITIDDRLIHTVRRVVTKQRLVALSTLLALGSATAWAAPLGSVPHSFTAGDVISASQVNANFQAVVDGIDAVDSKLLPAGAVMMFDLSDCPTGWSALTTAHGRYLVGRAPGAALGQTVGTPLTNGEDRAAGNHVHDMRHEHPGAGSPGPGNGSNARLVYSDVAGAAYPSHGASRSDTGGVSTPDGTNAPYLQLTVCRRD